jgi:hypothetical protein
VRAVRCAIARVALPLLHDAINDRSLANYASPTGPPHFDFLAAAIKLQHVCERKGDIQALSRPSISKLILPGARFGDAG